MLTYVKAIGHGSVISKLVQQKKRFITYEGGGGKGIGEGEKGGRRKREQTNVAKNGDIVVALIEDSATVKTYYKENGHYRLQPENDTMEPIIVDNLKIIGKVIGLFRSYKY